MSRPPTPPAIRTRAMMPMISHFAAELLSPFAAGVPGVWAGSAAEAGEDEAETEGRPARSCSFSLSLANDRAGKVGISIGCASAGGGFFISVASSIAVGALTVCPQSLQKRAVSGTSVPQTGQFRMVVPPCREHIA